MPGVTQIDQPVYQVETDQTNWQKLFMQSKALAKNGTVLVDRVGSSVPEKQEVPMGGTFTIHWGVEAQFHVVVSITIPKYLALGTSGRLVRGTLALSFNGEQLENVKRYPPKVIFDVDQWLQNAVVDPWVNSVMNRGQTSDIRSYAMAFHGQARKLLKVPTCKLIYTDMHEQHYNSTEKTYFMALSLSIQVEADQLSFSNLGHDEFSDSTSDSDSSTSSFEELSFIAGVKEP